MTGLADEVPSNTPVIIRIPGNNPTRSGTTGTFTITTGREYTTTAYERSSNIPGI